MKQFKIVKIEENFLLSKYHKSSQDFYFYPFLLCEMFSFEKLSGYSFFKV